MIVVSFLSPTAGVIFSGFRGCRSPTGPWFVLIMGLCPTTLHKKAPLLSCLHLSLTRTVRAGRHEASANEAFQSRQPTCNAPVTAARFSALHCRPCGKRCSGLFKPQSLIRYVLQKLESFHSFTSTAQTVCRQASTQHAAATRTNSKMGFSTPQE